MKPWLAYEVWHHQILLPPKLKKFETLPEWK